MTFFLIDVFSIYCISCQKQAPIFHEVYSKIENNPELKRKVKMIGIAVGNNQKEVESFKKEYKTPYPVFTDPDFSAYASLGNPRAPYTIFLKKDAKGKYIVVNIHRGKYDSADDVMNDIRDCLYCDPNTYSCGLKGTD